MKAAFTLNRPARTGMPLYEQVESYLRAQITSGALNSGDMLPSVKELCEHFGGINHLTVRQAIKRLSDDNLVRSVQGRGSFVTQTRVREGHIAIVLPHLEDTLFIRIARGAQEAFEQGGVRSLILDSRGSDATEAGHIANLKDLPIDGALIFPMPNTDLAEQVLKLKMSGFEFVLVDRYFEAMELPCVGVDNFDGGYQSARHLARQGRRHVAWLGEMRSTTGRRRFDGVLAGLNDQGIACPGGLIKTIDVPPDAPAPYLQSVRELTRTAVAQLVSNPKVDALVCSSDPIALIALEYLRESGLRVPEDVALIGFDDIPEAAHSSPPLTTVRQPMMQVGAQAAIMLMERMAKRDTPPVRQELPVELVVRHSA